MNTLMFFYGTDCPHCDAMKPLIAKLEFETGIKLDARDVWKSSTDFRLYENYQADAKEREPECEGLPFFYDTKTEKYLCGEVSYKELRAWAVVK